MIHNPLANPLFLPALARIGGLLLVAALLVLAVERRRLRRPASLRESVLVIRVGSWAVMAPTFVLSVFAGGALALALVLFLTVQGLREFSTVTGIDAPARRLLLALGAAAVTVAAVLPSAYGALPVAGFLVLSGAALLRGGGEGSYRDTTVALFGFMYLPLMLGFLPLIARGLPHGTEVLLVVGVCVALSDVCAFCVGSVAGGARLAPRISPNKTVAGAAGNVLGAYLGLAVMAAVAPAGWPPALTLALPLVIAVASVWGDLLESLVKRAFAVKDAGTLVPGFGGILDRIDSLLVALPLAFLAVRLAG
ncbi:MAG TPA: phosphatidate cytidylyltransferase [Candidatus Dormibacteraeota bacterium]|jgi:phosphatidate cytidylyltransferase